MSLHTDVDLRLESPEQLKAVANDTRAKILTLLEDGPASAKRLSELLKMSHGKVGHHVKVLREAGLIEVVETKQVRALTERLYGLTFDRLSFAENAGDRLQFTLSQAAREAAPSAEQPFSPAAAFVTVRTSERRAEEFRDRLFELTSEFEADSDSDGEAVYGVSVAVFRTTTPGRSQ